MAQSEAQKRWHEKHPTYKRDSMRKLRAKRKRWVTILGIFVRVPKVPR
jgi:hypothetical protein